MIRFRNVEFQLSNFQLRPCCLPSSVSPCHTSDRLAESRRQKLDHDQRPQDGRSVSVFPSTAPADQQQRSSTLSPCPSSPSPSAIRPMRCWALRFPVPNAKSHRRPRPSARSARRKRARRPQGAAPTRTSWTRATPTRTQRTRLPRWARTLRASAQTSRRR